MSNSVYLCILDTISPHDLSHPSRRMLATGIWESIEMAVRWSTGNPLASDENDDQSLRLSGVISRILFTLIEQSSLTIIRKQITSAFGRPYAVRWLYPTNGEDRRANHQRRWIDYSDGMSHRDQSYLTRDPQKRLERMRWSWVWTSRCEPML